MRETSFIKQNKEKWKEFEKVLEDPNADPDKLNNLFVQVTDDLSYSRTFYPNRSVRVYLNNIAQQVFYSIYKNKKTRLGRLTYFWTHELPFMVHQAKFEFRLSFWVFIISMIIGVVSCYMDSDFSRIVLGDAYVDMTLENIESNDPMAVYKQRGEFGMSLGITINNLWVAFSSFAMGIFFSIGTFFFLIKNGVMVGAFQYFFVEEGLFLESFLTIWIHGTLEISALIIAGAAGITMGKGLVFPGTLTRIQSFQISARRGVKIMLGIVPIIVMAGFIEGYLTRYTETPDIVRVLFIFGCLAFVLMYFVWLPFKRGKEKMQISLRDNQLPPDASQKIDFNRIKSVGEIFSDIFVFYKKYLWQIGGTAFLCALLYCLLVFPFSPNGPSEIFYFPENLLGTSSVLYRFFSNDSIPNLLIINIAIFSVLTFVSFTFLIKESEGGFAPYEHGKRNAYFFLNFLKILAVAALLMVIMQTNEYSSLFSFLRLGTPIIILWMYVMYKENTGFFSSIGRTFYLLGGNSGRTYGLFFLLLAVSFLFFMIMDSSLLWFYIQLVSMNLALEQHMMDQFTAISFTFLAMVVLYLIYPLLINGIGLLYSTLVEIKEARHLKERVENIGTAKVIQGMERE